MGDLGNHGLDLPFEPDDSGGILHDEHKHLSGGLVVMAATVPIDGETKPALVFRFATPVGGFYPPVVLVTDDAQMAKLRPLIQEAIAAARRAAAS